MKLFTSLASSQNMHPGEGLAENASASDVTSAIQVMVATWAAQNAEGDLRFKFPAEEGCQVVETILGA